MIASYTDFWFQSIYDEPTIPSNIKGIGLIHTPQTCLVHQKNSDFQVPTAYDSDIVNTVGAGDYFAGNFIATQLLSESSSLKNKILHAHTLTLDILKRQEIHV